MKFGSEKEFFRKNSLEKINTLNEIQKKKCSEKLYSLFFKTIGKNIDADSAVAVYANDNTEISIDPICERLLSKGVMIAFPLIESNSMTFYSVKDLKDLNSGSYGIRQPQKEKSKKIEAFDFMLIPGRAFDVYGNRIGRGAGYYDRFLEHKTCSYTVGVAFDFQVHQEKLPMEQQDIVMHKVITEKKIYDTEELRFLESTDGN